MARYNKDGFAYDQLLADDIALPAAGNSVDTTNVGTLNSTKGGNLRLIVVAGSTGVTIASGKVLTITPLVGTTTTPTTKLPAIVLTQGVTANTTFAAGDVISEIVLSRWTIGTNKYVSVNIASDADLSSKKVSVYLLAD